MSTRSSKQENLKKDIKKYLYMFAITMKWVLITGIIAGFFVGGIAFGYASALVKDDPIRSEEEILTKIQENAVTGFIYFNDDSLIGQIRSEQNRRLIAYNEVPEIIINAFMAIEDNDFRKHAGVDISGFTRAAMQKVLNKPVQTGGSTITQQLARQVFLTLDPTSSRKAKEILLSLRMERYLSKNQILEAYMNKIPFGNGSNGYYTYGILAASQGIFKVNDLDQLNIAQVAYLVGLPQNPNSYSAFTSKGTFDEEGFSAAMERQKLVLKRMYEESKITAQEYETALQFDVKSSLAPTEQKAYTTYPFLMIEAERKAAETLLKITNPEFTAADFRDKENNGLINEAVEELRRGYKIYTTIDQTIYDAMQEIGKNPDNFLPEHAEKGIEQIGAIMLDNKTSAILGMLEGRDFYEEQLNHATQMIRQPGSTMKPISAFLPALEEGLIQPASIIDDLPMILEDGSKGYHIPNNWDIKFHGLITARRALDQSYNIPALMIYNDIVQIDKALDFTKTLGITTITDNDYNHKTGVIGGLDYGTTVEELANAYATIANQGQFNDAYMIRKIEDPTGKVVYEHQTNPTGVFSQETAYLMTDMMRTVISSGTGSTIRNTFKNYGKVPVVGKTGSTQNDHDAWFMGYSPDITVGVWAGYDQQSTLLISQGAGHRAKNIWSLIMDKAIELRPELFSASEFERPENIVSRTVSSVSGKLPNTLASESNLVVTDIFNRAYIPDEEENALTRMKVVSYNGVNYIALATTPEDMITERVVVKREQNVFELLKRIEGILNNMSSSNRPKKRGGALMTAADYRPLDMHLTAPVEADPRQDDGKAPNPPSGVALTKVDERTTKITFQVSSSEDVVGYRFYRSFDGRPFAHVPKQNVLTGQNLEVVDFISPQYEHAYFLTAVDVAGNESSPSQIVSTNSNSSGILIPPINSGNEDEADPGGGNNGSVNGSNNNTIPNDSVNQASIPQGVQISSQDGIAAVQITWDANPQSENINRYQIYYSETQSGEFRRIGSSNTTRFEYITLPLEGWYAVAAENNNGASELSTPVEYK